MGEITIGAVTDYLVVAANSSVVYAVCQEDLENWRAQTHENLPTVDEVISWGIYLYGLHNEGNEITIINRNHATINGIHIYGNIG